MFSKTQQPQTNKNSFEMCMNDRYQAALLTAEHIVSLKNGESKRAQTDLKTLQGYAHKMSSDPSVNQSLINTYYFKAFEYRLL